MELRHLRYFQAVASELSFSRAAQRLHMAQPPLSRQIRQLEEEVGATLIDRAARPLQLTPAGRFFFDQSVHVLERIEEVCEATRRIAAGKRAWFGIGFVPSMLYGLLPDLVHRFRATAQGVEVGLMELTTVQQAEALEAGRIDVGFGRIALENDAIACEAIVEEPLVAALPARHRLLSARRLDLRRLATEPLVLYPARTRPSFGDQVLQMFRARDLVPTVAMEVNEMQTAIGLVAAGVGVTLVPASVQRLHRDDVAYRPLADADAVSPVLMYFRTEDRSVHLAHFRALVTQARETP
jgi:DNA-binding transcriptional LysR family regulator